MCAFELEVGSAGAAWLGRGLAFEAAEALVDVAAVQGQDAPVIGEAASVAREIGDASRELLRLGGGGLGLEQAAAAEKQSDEVDARVECDAREHLAGSFVANLPHSLD